LLFAADAGAAMDDVKKDWLIFECGCETWIIYGMRYIHRCADCQFIDEAVKPLNQQRKEREQRESYYMPRALAAVQQPFFSERISSIHVLSMPYVQDHDDDRPNRI